MKLIVDIGNSRIKAAIFNEEELLDVTFCTHQEIDQLKNLILKYGPTKAIVSSVADPKVAVAELLEQNGIAPIFFNRDIPLPLTLVYDENSQPGLDRIADAVAIHSLSNKKNKLIIDAGTCITYNYVFGDRFEGGAISPGLIMRYKALNTFTGRLPLIHERRHIHIVGSSTKESIQSGVINGIVMEINGLCSLFQEQYEDSEIFITGGDGIFFAEGLKNTIFADPYLTLKGLNKILLFNEI